MPHFDFDAIIDRSGTNALALEGYAEYLFGGQTPEMRRGELLPMWVADMQFASPPAVIEAIRARASHPIFGYTGHFDDELFSAFNRWSQSRYGWVIPRDHMQVSLGVIPALYTLVDLICRPGDKVLTLSPGYGYFAKAANRGGVQLITSPLTMESWYPQIDFDDLAAKIRDPRVRMFFLCHPHNPTGRAWSESELSQLADLCAENGVLVVSDEVHCDLLREGLRHVPLTRLRPSDTNIVTCMAPSKTFNLAGLMTAVICIPDEELRSRWRAAHYPFANPLGLAAAVGAYNGGSPWLEELRAYLDANFAVLAAFIEAELPMARFRIPEATYLAWIDLSAYFPVEINLTNLILTQGGVILEGGEMFIDNGRAAVRLNIACPRSTMMRALESMAAVITRSL